MSLNLLRAAVAAAACLALAPAMATGLASSGSSASSAGSASLKGSSGSIDSLSDSSSDDKDKAKDKTAMVQDGAYRVAGVQPAADAHALRLQLEPQVEGAQPFALTVPTEAFGGQTPVAGDLVHATRRDYGVQFPRAQSQDPFFLVVADAWMAELDSRPITR